MHADWQEVASGLLIAVATVKSFPAPSGENLTELLVDRIWDYFYLACYPWVEKLPSLRGEALVQWTTPVMSNKFLIEYFGPDWDQP